MPQKDAILDHDIYLDGPLTFVLVEDVGFWRLIG